MPGILNVHEKLFRCERTCLNPYENVTEISVMSHPVSYISYFNFIHDKKCVHAEFSTFTGIPIRISCVYSSVSFVPKVCSH